MTTDKIEDAFVAVRKPALDQAVANGRMTQAQADAMLTLMRTNATGGATGTPGGRARRAVFDAEGKGEHLHLATSRRDRARFNPSLVSMK